MAAVAAGCTAAASVPDPPAGPNSSPAGPAATASPRGGAGVRWMIAIEALQALRASDPALVARDFIASNTFVIQAPDQAPTALGIPLARFRSFAGFQAALASRGIDAAYHWVLYDNEHWAATPVAEQANPASYMAQFVALAHAHGYQVVLAPAQDLVGGTWQAYLVAGLARAGARGDAYEIQAQSDEGTPAYRQFVSAAAAQARAVHPGVSILAGVSTERVTSASQISQDIASTSGIVNGYWLNIPDLGTNGGKPPHLGYAVQAVQGLG